MNELKERYKIAKWISDEVLGRLSKENQENLTVWRNSAAAHEMEYKEIKTRLRTDLQERRLLDPEKEWQEFQKSLFRKRRSLHWLYYVAAIVLIGIFTVAVIKKQKGIPESLELSAVGQKAYKAVLILNDGRKIDIGDPARKNIPLEIGVIVDSGNRVKYEMQQQLERPVEYNTIVVPRGAEYEICLADGTQVWLNSESRLTYPVCFNGTERRVEMDGEICFQVAKNAQKPFIVKAGEIDVTVLGTLFNIEAYPGNEKVVTTLVEGKVKVQHGEHQCYLQPDHQVTVEDGVLTVKEIVAKDYVSWVNGFFHFTESPLEEIMTKLARWYNVEFFFANPSLEDIHFTLDIRRYETITAILSKIEKTGRVHFSVNGKTLIIQD